MSPSGPNDICKSKNTGKPITNKHKFRLELEIELGSEVLNNISMMVVTTTAAC